MMNVLSNALEPLEQLLSGPCGFSADEHAEVFRDLTAAWDRAFFSETSDQCLRRYFNFQIEGIARIAGTFALDKRPERPELSGLLGELVRHIVARYRSYFDHALYVPKPYYTIWQHTQQQSFALTRDRIAAAPLHASLKSCLLEYFGRHTGSPTSVLFTFRSLFYGELLSAQFSAAELAGPEAEQHICDILHEHNFNHLHYLSYCQTRILASLHVLSGQKKQLFLKQQLSGLAHLPDQPLHTYHPDWPPLKIMLQQFLREEIGLLEQKSPLYTDQARTAKLPLNLSVAQLACLIRLFYEEGLFGTENLSDIFRFFSENFRSKRQGHISAGSLSKEYYSISQVTAAVLGGKLSAMVARINRKFFPV